MVSLAVPWIARTSGDGVVTKPYFPGDTEDATWFIFHFETLLNCLQEKQDQIELKAEIEEIEVVFESACLSLNEMKDEQLDDEMKEQLAEKKKMLATLENEVQVDDHCRTCHSPCNTNYCGLCGTKQPRCSPSSPWSWSSD
jgi:hypothetical protein